MKKEHDNINKDNDNTIINNTTTTNLYNIIDSNIPILLSKHAISWDCNEFYNRLTVGDLSSTIITFRLSPLLLSLRTIREHESITILSSLSCFYQWINNNDVIDILNPFYNIDKNVSAYGDYLRFKEIFEHVPKFGKWSTLFNRTIPNFNEDNATLWIGSKGCHTPLHYDTYGKNVIIQIKGTKRWKIWRPDNHNMLPLRLPFEESSVYSSHDPRNGHNNGSCVPPPDYEFVLEEGDVLFVPKHFWHYVETESDIAVSINVWLQETDDSRDQLSEAISLFVFGALKQAVDDADDRFCTSDLANGWISPSEVGGTLASCGNDDDDNDDDDNDDNGNVNDDDNDNNEDNDNNDGNDSNAHVLHDSNFALIRQTLAGVLNRPVTDDEEVDIIKKIINRLVHPTTIKKCIEDIGII